MWVVKRKRSMRLTEILIRFFGTVALLTLIPRAGAILLQGKHLSSPAALCTSRTLFDENHMAPKGEPASRRVHLKVDSIFSQR